MAGLGLAIACGDYDRTRPLADGRVRIEGVDPSVVVLPPEEMFWRMIRHREFDVSELSFSSYVLMRSRGEDEFVAIPVFPSRSFRHSAIYVRTSAGVARPADLRGRRVGVPEYAMTAAVWARGHLHHDYGVAPHEIEWVTGGLEDPGRIEKLRLDVPPEIRIRPAGPDRTLNAMLVGGEIDALIAPRPPSSFRKRDPRVARLFPSYRDVEAEYFRRTGIFPIMHVIVLRRDVYEKHRWLVRSLFKAFERAKRLALESFEEDAALRLSHPWIAAEAEILRELLGEDWWPYGVEANRTTIEMLVRHSHEQGLAKRMLDAEELFPPESLDEAKT
ncbi:MAG: ABC transporter substrate-binding protein [Candidatus Binatia bacterium]